MAKVNPIQLQKYLKGIKYPASKKEIIARAQEGGADSNIKQILQRLPEETYQTPADVSQAVGRIQ